MFQQSNNLISKYLIQPQTGTINFRHASGGCPFHPLHLRQKTMSQIFFVGTGQLGWGRLGWGRQGLGQLGWDRWPNNPDQHHSHEVLNLPHKFYLYLIFIFFLLSLLPTFAFYFNLYQEFLLCVMHFFCYITMQSLLSSNFHSPPPQSFFLSILP